MPARVVSSSRMRFESPQFTIGPRLWTVALAAVGTTCAAPPVALHTTNALNVRATGTETAASPNTPVLPNTAASPNTTSIDGAPANAPLAPQLQENCPALSVEPFPVEPVAQPTLAAPPIENGSALADFYEQAARMLRRGRPEQVRIGVYGDSNLTRDYFTSSLRRSLQLRYGDAGHGFLAVGRPWPWYRHIDVVQELPAFGWHVWAMSSPQAPDKRYGPSGITAEGYLANARVLLATAPAGSPIGKTVDRATIYFLTQPGGGSFDVLVDGARAGSVNTDASDRHAAARDFSFVEGPHRVEIVTTSNRPTRLLGAALERSTKGFIVDSFGIGGAYYRALTQEDPETARETGVLRPHALLAYWFGANTHFSDTYGQDVGLIMTRRRQVHPGQALIMIAPPDIQRKSEDPHSDPAIARVVEKLRKEALLNGVAFYNLYQAMGGHDSMGRFRSKGLAIDDHHLNERGAHLMANRFLSALWDDFRRHLAEHPKAGCEPTGATP